MGSNPTRGVSFFFIFISSNFGTAHLKCTVIKLLIFLLSSAFERIGGKHYRCQILSCNSNGKLDYFKRNFNMRFAAITQFENVREPHGELGRVE